MEIIYPKMMDIFENSLLLHSETNKVMFLHRKNIKFSRNGKIK